jgi:hypothetical protein
MLSGIVQAGTKALGGSRFSLVNLMPATFLVGFIISMIVSGAYSGDEIDPGKAMKVLSSNTGWAIVAVFGVFVLAVLLRPFQAALVQVLEGYWQRWPVKHLTALATERHRRIQNTATIMSESGLEVEPAASRSLQHVVDAQRKHRRIATINARAEATVGSYPLTAQVLSGTKLVVTDRLMPTLLGNVLRDGEDNAGRRYGLSLPVVAPRLWTCLSPKLSTAISQSLDLIDTASALCISFALASVASLHLVAGWNPWSLTPLVTAALSVLAYRGAVRMSRGHARLLATAIDVHRFDLLSALHYELPTSIDDERELFGKLWVFLDNRSTAKHLMSGTPYEHPEPTPITGQDAASPTEPPSADGGSDA